MIRQAYEIGAFPMADEFGAIGWYRPHRRALLPIEGMRVSRRLARTISRGPFEVRFDTCFVGVVAGCASRSETWISDEIARVYTVIHQQGWAHSAETWLDGELVGGVYGVSVGACFSAESMFFRVRDASKVALHAMIQRCRQLGFELFDAQVMNPHLASLGAFEVDDIVYMALLEKALLTEIDWPTKP